MKLVGKTALVTGGSSGIGQSVARRLADEGARLVVSGAPTDSADLQDTVRALQARCTDVIGIPADMADTADVAALVEAALAHLGHLDILVCNAGTYWTEPFLEITEEHWDHMLAVNLRGMFLAGQRVARHMATRGKGGVIINTASTNALLGDEDAAHYNVSKAGIVALTKSMALDLAPHQIRVNCVCPGMILTRLSGAMSDDPNTVTTYAKRIPLDRFGTAEEVANAYVFLASDDASYMTGTCLVYDGGLTAGLRWHGWIT